MQDAFARIYATNAWGSGSGAGSLAAYTQTYREFLQQFMREKSVRSVVDVGCGDWQIGSLVDWSGIDYLGIDVVPSVIETNRAKYASSSVRFACRDVAGEPLEQADLLIIKDVLQHWPLRDVQRFLVEQLRRFRYALITNCVEPRAGANGDISAGGWRPLDLNLAPFRTGLPVVLTFTGPGWCKEVLQWEVGMRARVSFDKVNIGCGADFRSDHWNVDVGPFQVDERVDAFAPLPWADETWQMIHARDVLEHTSWAQTETVFAEWVRVLKPGGQLLVQVPNLRYLCEQYVAGAFDAKKASYWIFGGHETSYGVGADGWRLNAHYAGFDVARLTELCVANRLVVDVLVSDGGSNLILHARKP